VIGAPPLPNNIDVQIFAVLITFDKPLATVEMAEYLAEACPVAQASLGITDSTKAYCLINIDSSTSRRRLLAATRLAFICTPHTDS
jgi:hypothetical protein